MDLAQPCALLDENHKCVIYGLRPAACATYFVLSDPKLCYPPTKSKVSAVNNLSVTKALLDLDAWFMSRILDIQLPVVLAFPLGYSVAMGAVILTKGLSGLNTSYLNTSYLEGVK